jgi:hypothetical protein
LIVLLVGHGLLLVGRCWRLVVLSYRCYDGAPRNSSESRRPIQVCCV